MDDYLAKPVNPGALADTLRRWIPATPVPRPEPGTAPDLIVGRLYELAGDRSPADIDLVNFLVNSFLARMPDQVTALCAACEAGDAEAVEDHAHSLKGAADNIGATAVMEVCERLENDARAGELPEAIVDVRTLRRELDRVEVQLRDVLTEHFSPI